MPYEMFPRALISGAIAVAEKDVIGMLLLVGVAMALTLFVVVSFWSRPHTQKRSHQ